MQIVTFGAEVLKQPARHIPEITQEIKDLAAAMINVMHESNGVGLAAEQIGRTENICVIDIPPDAEDEEHLEANSLIPMPLVLVNPEIESADGTERRLEGCLSFPDIFVPITRPATVTFSYTDLEGQRHTATARGLLARAVLHETDHLKGILLTDRMSQTQKIANAGKLRKLRLSNRRGGASAGKRKSFR